LGAGTFFWHPHLGAS